MRLLMVLSSFAPLFVFWSLQKLERPITYLEHTLVTQTQWFWGCLTLAILPTLALCARYLFASKDNDTRTLTVVQCEDHSDHLLTYLIANLLPFYASQISTLRGFATVILAVAFVVFIMWRMNMHYINVFFALLRYKVYTITLDETEGRKAIFLSRRNYIAVNSTVKGVRLSDTVFIERS